MCRGTSCEPAAAADIAAALPAARPVASATATARPPFSMPPARRTRRTPRAARARGATAASTARLEGDGLQWPCPDASHPGTAVVHASGFLRGRAQLAVVPYVASPESGYPLTLVTGRVRDHYDVGSMTRRTPHLALSPPDTLALNPVDAHALGIADGARVRVDSHANRVVGPARDPESRCPEYKLTAVRLAPA